MFLLLTLPILVSGFFYCHIGIKTRQKLYRYEGQYLYLLTASYGILSLVLGTLFTVSLYLFVPETITLFSVEINIDVIKHTVDFLTETEVVPDKQYSEVSWLLCIAFSTLIAPFFLYVFSYGYWCVIFRTINPTTHITGAILKDSPMDDLLFEASKIKSNDYNLMLSLEDRKVYLGRVVSLGEPNEADGRNQEVAMIPILSGYRDSNTLRVEFTTDYDDSDNDLLLVIRQEDIVSATKFSIDAYENLNPEKPTWSPV